MDLTPIVMGIVAIFGAIWTYFLVPYLKARKSSEDLMAITETLTHTVELVRIFVEAAEQVGKALGYTGSEKMVYVQQHLAELGYDLSPEIISMIEAEVLKLPHLSESK